MIARVRSNVSGVGIFDAAVGYYSRIIYKAVDSSKAGNCFLDKLCRDLGVFKRTDDEGRIVSDLGSQFLRCVFRLPWIMTLRAFASKEPHHGLSDAGGRAGHQDYFVLKRILAEKTGWLMAGALL